MIVILFKFIIIYHIVWKEPTEKDLAAPKDIALLIRESVYWNSEGHLDKAPPLSIFQYSFTVFVGDTLILILFYVLFQVIGFSGGLLSSLVAILAIAILSISGYLFYQWGWKTYREAWYHFNDKDELFTVLRRNGRTWESIEIPYEEIDSIDFEQGPNGKALIISGQFSFETSRTKEKRFSSITELWPNLARMDRPMKNWPINLFCSVCRRSFGHHIGTAICPWDNIALLDVDAKGRFDPIEQNPEDLDRI